MTESSASPRLPGPRLLPINRVMAVRDVCGIPYEPDTTQVYLV